jgi:hypothetical protein
MSDYALTRAEGKINFFFKEGWAKIFLGRKKNTLLQALVSALACSGLQECIFSGLALFQTQSQIVGNHPFRTLLKTFFYFCLQYQAMLHTFAP